MPDAILQGGLWTVCKQLLPRSALSKVFFATAKAPLVPDFFAAQNLPLAFGGQLDTGPEIMPVDFTAEAYESPPELMESDDERDEVFYTPRPSRAPSRKPSFGNSSDSIDAAIGSPSVTNDTRADAAVARRPSALRSVSPVNAVFERSTLNCLETVDWRISLCFC